jgi:hypothetical protein
MQSSAAGKIATKNRDSNDVMNVGRNKVERGKKRSDAAGNAANELSGVAQSERDNSGIAWGWGRAMLPPDSFIRG